jgi:hypothetical protein
MSEHLSDYWLERYALRELPEKKMKKIHRLLETQDGLRQRLEDIQASNTAVLGQYPSGRQAAQIQEKFEARSRVTAARQPNPALRWALPGTTLAAAAVLGLCLLPGNFFPWQRAGAGGDTTRLKGMETGLTIYRQQAAAAELLQPYAYAQRGDLLQIGYVSVLEPYGVILSLDGRGTVTLHYPESARAIPKLQTRRKALLPKAYELDDAPAFERFFLVTSSSPFSPETVLQAARALAKNPQRAFSDDLPLNRTWRQYSLVIQKAKH